MKKFSVLGLALVLVLGFSVMAGAASADVNVNIEIAEYTEISAPESITVRFDEPDQNKTAYESFSVKSNCPVTLSLTSNGAGTGWGTGNRHPKLNGPAGELVEPNLVGGLNWSVFISRDMQGTTTDSTPNGLGEVYDVAQGSNTFYLALNANWAGDQWYDLTAGTYTGEVTLTVAPQSI